ncbi:MAG: hypothetical protein BGO57_13050 [Sphingomonadales bacterium 63-6]|nr:MAG: hypothetical protein BGO57_13050 [Sphingomonadales bacterium 63-6]
MVSPLQNLPFTMRQLVIFETLAETRSFRRSADLLGISQASVSSQFKALEEQLGICLMLRRAGRRPELTAYGESFLSDLRLFSGAATQLASYRRRQAMAAAPVRFQVLLGLGLADFYVRPKLDQFVAAHPHIILEFDTRSPSRELVATARSKPYDFVFIHQRADLPLPPDMRSLAITPGGIYGDRAFAEGRSLPLSAEEVMQLPFALHSAQDDVGEWRLRQALPPNMRPTNIVGRIQFFEVIISMLNRGQAVTNMPIAMVPMEMRDRVVQLFPMHDWRLMFYRKEADDNVDRDAVEAFLLSSVLQDPAYTHVLDDCPVL